MQTRFAAVPGFTEKSINGGKYEIARAQILFFRLQKHGQIVYLRARAKHASFVACASVFFPAKKDH